MTLCSLLAVFTASIKAGFPWRLAAPSRNLCKALCMGAANE
jgi:hypothetical protein